MKPFPHTYAITAAALPEGNVSLRAPGLAEIPSAPPTEFDGPGDQWSPELLLLAAVADCFALTFRAIAQASKFAWVDLRCEATGTLDRVDGGLQFVAIRLEAKLEVPAGSDAERGRNLLEKAKKTCIVTRSLATPVELVAHLGTTN